MATLEENSVVGPYRIIRKLGQGGMGSVYEALHQTLGRHVAIKVLHPEVARNEEFALRFANEARASNIVDHPDVVQITDHGSLPDGIPYIVMEYLKGESLGHRIEHLGGPMNPSEVAYIALQVADVLAAAHIKGIIHRENSAKTGSCAMWGEQPVHAPSRADGLRPADRRSYLATDFAIL